MPAGSANRWRWIPLLGGIVLLAVLLTELGPGQVGSLLTSIGPNVLVIVALFASHECLRAWCLSRCLPPRHRPPFRRLLRIRFLGEALQLLTHTGPFVSEPARVWMLAQHSSHTPAAYAAAVSELLISAWASALVTVLILGFVMPAFALRGRVVALSDVLLAGAVAYLVIAIVALAKRMHVISGVVRALGAVPLVGRLLKHSPAHVREMEDAIFDIWRSSPASLARVIALELLAQSILVFEIYWALTSMGVAVSIAAALLVEALTKVANVIQIIGATEGSYALVFDWMGMTATVGFTLALMKRVRSVAVAVLGLGALTLIDRAAPSRHQQVTELTGIRRDTTCG